MYNVVIFSNNLNLIKKFSNIIFKHFDNMRFSGFASNKKELSALCETSNINMIILSDKDSKKDSLLPLLKHIENKIIIYDVPNNFKNSKYTLYIPYCADTNFIIEKLNKFAYKSGEKAIRLKIHHILETLNFDFKLVGTNYLLESIVYSYFTKDKYHFENLEKRIYPYVSQKYNLSVENIKWSIIRAVNHMKFHSSSKELEKYNLLFIEKITPKSIILEIVNRL